MLGGSLGEATDNVKKNYNSTRHTKTIYYYFEVPPIRTPDEPVRGPVARAPLALNWEGVKDARSAPEASPLKTFVRISAMLSATVERLSMASEFMCLSRELALYS